MIAVRHLRRPLLSIIADQRLLATSIRFRIQWVLLLQYDESVQVSKVGPRFLRYFRSSSKLDERCIEMTHNPTMVSDFRLHVL